MADTAHWSTKDDARKVVEDVVPQVSPAVLESRHENDAANGLALKCIPKYCRIAVRRKICAPI